VYIAAPLLTILMRDRLPVSGKQSD
jgi:hypothetical protein